MKKVFKQHLQAGSRKSDEPRRIGDILDEMFRSDSYFATGSRRFKAAPAGEQDERKEQGWHRNTHLCVDLKTYLRSNRIMEAEREYTGVLRRDYDCDDLGCDEHFTFTETNCQGRWKRNPQVYDGRHVTLTMRPDGSLRPNLKPIRIEAGFPIGDYATDVGNELLQALSGLVKE